MTTFSQKSRLALAVFALGFGLVGVTSPAHALTFSFTKKLDLNPLPFTDAAQNAYWHGRGKYSNSTDVWQVTVTLNEADKHPNTPIPGVIAISNIHFQAVNMRTGELHQVNLQGFVSSLDNSVLLMGTTASGVNVTLNGVVRSWWTVKGVRKGAHVIQGVLSFN